MIFMIGLLMVLASFFQLYLVIQFLPYLMKLDDTVKFIFFKIPNGILFYGGCGMMIYSLCILIYRHMP